ncbi:kinase-like protein [Gigaspora margarita]|uniref:Kinase-like protein n=1 Tax=Gigaspora margarita TaxID=4874 RepID=A0A8H4ES11_GIGMA|nr:kinase-like protein [Gigaspora margarita]
MSEEPNIIKNTLENVAKVTNAVSSFVPVLDFISKLINEIVSIYEKSEFSKNMCSRLVDRVLMAELEVKRLKLIKKQYEGKLCDQEYYDSLQKFKTTLEKIKRFVDEFSNMKSINKTFRATEIKDRFDSLADEFDTRMRDLNFTITIDFEMQRKLDNDELKISLNEIKQILKISGLNSEVISEVQIMKSQDTSVFKPIQIDPKDLIPATTSSDELQRKGNFSYLCKRMYNFEEVACKEFKHKDSNDIKKKQKIQKQLAILERLSECKYILKFYGLSRIEGKDVQVLQWAELGSLKDVYTANDIDWVTKVSIARDICRGLAFLESVEILHHDIRAENIMMTADYKPKIANFDVARRQNETTSEIPDLKKVVRWMAPEKIKGESYTTRCEIFSFGMLLWELTYEKEPYQDFDSFEYIKNLVINGYREKISFCPTQDSTIKNIQQEFECIMKSTWQDNPKLRMGVGELYLNLEKLAEKYVKPGDLPKIFNDKELDFDGSKFYGNDIDCIDQTLPELKLLKFYDIEIKEPTPLNEGIKIHQSINKKGPEEEIKKMRKQAWECFEENAKLGNPVAKYWKGYYLWEGYYVDKNKEDAMKLFKEAADNNVPGAQLRYAFALLPDPPSTPITKQTQEEFIKYLTFAADNCNPFALFHLGDMYLSGKFQVKKDRDLAIRKLKLAASLGNENAKAILKKEGEIIE